MAWPLLAAAGITALGSIGGGILAGKNSGNETKTQKQRRHLMDDLINSIKTGTGPYADLFNFDENAFQKSFVDPAKNIFKNQIAPQIQQSYSAGGGYGGTGMEDQLARAGVNLDDILNQHYMNFQENSKNRTVNALNGLSSGSEGTQGMGTGQATANATAGYLNSQGFSNNVDKIFAEFNKDKTGNTGNKGFEPV